MRLSGASGTPSGDSQPAAGAPLRGDPPILAAGGDALRPVRYEPGRRIALTFDDGPDPHWTPRVAATLQSLNVPATFFLVGQEVVEHPDVAASLHEQGFELGSHTFTHADITRLSGWRRSLELSLAENAIVGATGIRPRLVRPPYTSLPAHITPSQERALASGADRRLYALADIDSKDWRRPGASAITDAATPPGREGGVVLLHDGGGDRAETVAALKELVPRLRARGFEFVTVSELIGSQGSAVEVPASAWQRFRGEVLIATLTAARWAAAALVPVLAAATVLLLMRICVVFLLARKHVRAVRAEALADFSPPVSVLVPAFNESIGIVRTVRALASSDYPEFEVIVIDDGSSDGTGEIVERLGLSRVRVLHQANRGKPVALNRGLSAAAHDFIVTVDADTIFDRDSLRRLMRPFRDASVGAASGNTKVGNRSGLLGRWQHIEYVMGFNLDRRLYDVLRCMPTVPGAIGAFRRQALTDIGGVSSATLAEDTDITIAIGRLGWRVVYVEDARAWTEAPASLRALWRQRYRWSYGTMQAAWKHRAATWRRREGAVGRRGLPYLALFQIGLPLLAPVIDVYAIYGVVFLDPLPVLGYWLGFNALQLLLAWYAFRLDHESPGPLLVMPLQQLVYRQLMYLVVVESLVSALVGTRLRWQRMERTGDVEVAP